MLIYAINDQFEVDLEELAGVTTTENGDGVLVRMREREPLLISPLSPEDRNRFFQAILNT